MSEKAGRRITNVYRFVNGLVAVCDQFGQQMPRYQGRYADLRETILRDAPADAVFHGGAWPNIDAVIPREEW